MSSTQPHHGSAAAKERHIVTTTTPRRRRRCLALIRQRSILSVLRLALNLIPAEAKKDSCDHCACIARRIDEEELRACAQRMRLSARPGGPDAPLQVVANPITTSTTVLQVMLILNTFTCSLCMALGRQTLPCRTTWRHVQEGACENDGRRRFPRTSSGDHLSRYCATSSLSWASAIPCMASGSRSTRSRDASLHQACEASRKRMKEKKIAEVARSMSRMLSMVPRMMTPSNTTYSQ